MNRKKILICLGTQDDACLEMAFIEQQLAHPHHFVMKFYLESLIRDEFGGVYRQSTQSTNVGLESKSQLLNKMPKEVFSSAGLKNGKRQVITSSSVKELLTESQFADLLMIRHTNFHTLCAYYGQKKTMQEVLKKSGCPILVIPDIATYVEQIVLIYDGISTAIHAIKALHMALPDLCRSLPVTVLIPSPCSRDHIPANEEKLLIEYLRLHFKDLGVHKVCEDSIHTIHSAIDNKKKTLIVNNHPGQILPAYITEALQMLMKEQNDHYYQFIVSALPSQ